MVDISTAFGYGRQAYYAVNYIPTLQAFQAERNISTGLGLLNATTGVLGMESVIAHLVKYGVEISLGVHNENLKAANEMVELMRSRVPVDTGRLLNGFRVIDEGDAVVVLAEAVHPGADHNYARDVEFGRGQRVYADDSFFADDRLAGAPLHSRSSTGGGQEAHPFFLNSADEVRQEWGERLKSVPDVSD